MSENLHLKKVKVKDLKVGDEVLVGGGRLLKIKKKIYEGYNSDSKSLRIKVFFEDTIYFVYDECRVVRILNK